MGFYGDLEDLPLQDILYVLASRGKSGRLTLSTASDQITLLFDRGRVAAVTTSDVNLRIGHLLVDQGYVTEEQMEQALALQSVSGSGARIGDVLVELGYVTRREIGLAVAAQFEASLFRVLVQPGGSFAFEPEDSIVADPLTDDVPIEAMVLNAVRRADEWLASHTKNESLTLVDRALEPEELDDLGDHERSTLIALLNGATTFYTLATSTGLSAPELRKAIESLVATGVLARGEPVQPAC